MTMKVPRPLEKAPACRTRGTRMAPVSAMACRPSASPVNMPVSGPPACLTNSRVPSAQVTVAADDQPEAPEEAVLTTGPWPLCCAIHSAALL